MMTDHGKKRLRKRLRIVGDLDAHLDEVLTNGTHYNQATGVLRRYLDEVFYGGSQYTRELIVYDGALYIFSNDAMLITAWRLKSQGEMKNEQDLRDQRLARSARSATKSNRRYRRTSAALRQAHDHNYR